MKESVLKNKSYLFAIRIVRLSQYVQKNANEFVLSKQILRSGTSVGALIREAEFAQSPSDFIHKMHISLKEANETAYWLCILRDTNYIEQKLHESLNSECQEVISMLVSSINTVKRRVRKEE